MSEEIIIDLSQHSFPDGTKLFADSELKLKNKNFIFAKNGSGKSTLTNIIKEKCSDMCNVCVFQGFESVIGADRRLNVVVLGEENLELQKQIDTLDETISNLNANKATLESEKKITQKNVSDQTAKIGKFHTDSAREITNTLNLGRNYNKNKFKSDITNAKKIESNELAQLKKIQTEQAKANISEVKSLNIDLSAYLQSVNEIITSNIEKPTAILGLSENPSDEKGKFARYGMEIHEHKENEACAFCGQMIPDFRWEDLQRYFSDEYQKLEERIQKGKTSLTQLKEQVTQVSLSAKNEFYSIFETDAQSKIQSFKEIQEEYKKFIDELIVTLANKSNNMAERQADLLISIPEGIDENITALNSIIKQNNDYTEKLEEKINAAKQTVKLHEVAVKLENFCYDAENQKLKHLEEINSDKEIEIQKVQTVIKEENVERQELVKQTKNVEIIVNKINSRLEKSGHSNVKLVFEGKGNQGTYRIENDIGNRRNVEQLSTGEKNVIALLYFINRLDESNDGQPKLVIFDDPMTSNDDTMQYLIIMELQKLLKTIGDNYVVIMTHNNHFYLNVKFDNNNYKKNNFYHLNHDGEKSIFTQITKKEDDFQTNYEQLWQELKFLYGQSKPQFMLNTLRRILETYTKFNNINENEFYRNHPESKKLFNVNSHSIDDLEADLNGKNQEQVMEILETLFEDNSASEHFRNHWIPENEHS